MVGKKTEKASTKENILSTLKTRKKITAATEIRMDKMYFLLIARVRVYTTTAAISVVE